LVRATLVLARADLVAELAFELKMSVFFYALKLHGLERAIVLVLIELGFKNLVTDAKVSVSSFFPAVTNLLCSFL
jgi:hypothetical protein